MKKITLGMLIPEFPTQTHIFFWREIEALRELGAEVHVISTRRPTEACPHDFAVAAIKQTHYVYPPEKWSVIRMLITRPAGLLRSIRYILSLSERRMKAIGYLLCAADLAHFARKNGLDHIHVHSCADAAHIAAMAKLIHGTPYSLHLHGDLVVYGKDHIQKALHSSFVSAAARPMQAQLIESAGVPPNRTHTMWMGVDTAQFTPAVLQASGNKSLHLVSIGRLHLCKGHRYTLQALRLLLDEGANIEYTIAGGGPHLKEIEAAVAEGNFGGRVRIVGSLGENQVLALLSTADAFVLSSTGVGEASPVAVMEAMSAGIPVISSIIGGTPDMLEDGVDGVLVAQEDITGLANAIRRLHNDLDYRTQMGVAARKRACEQFDYHVTSKKLLSAIAKSLQ